MSACANPLHRASVTNRTKCDVGAQEFLFPDKNLNNGVPRCRCGRQVLPGNNSAIVVVKANASPDLEQQVCGQLAGVGSVNLRVCRCGIYGLAYRHITGICASDQVLQY